MSERLGNLGPALVIDRVKFTPSRPAEARKGLNGWVCFRLNRRLQIDGIMLRRTRDGRRVLSFPARRSSGGDQVFFVRPLDDETREEIEHQVFTALGRLN